MDEHHGISDNLINALLKKQGLELRQITNNISLPEQEWLQTTPLPHLLTDLARKHNTQEFYCKNNAHAFVICYRADSWHVLDSLLTRPVRLQTIGNTQKPLEVYAGLLCYVNYKQSARQENPAIPLTKHTMKPTPGGTAIAHTLHYLPAYTWRDKKRRSAWCIQHGSRTATVGWQTHLRSHQANGTNTDESTNTGCRLEKILHPRNR